MFVCIILGMRPKHLVPNPLDNDELRGDVSANPVETQAFMVFARPVNQAGVTTVFDIMVTIEFDTVWTELER